MARAILRPARLGERRWLPWVRHATMTIGSLDVPRMQVSNNDRGGQTRPTTGRRTILRALVGFAAVPLPWAAAALGRHRRARDAVRTVTLSLPRGEGITFHGEVILIATGEGLRAYSARCPHLGCIIAALQEGDLVCPCHGSRFAPSGRRISGPAASGLRQLRVTIRAAEEQVDVDLRT